MTHKAWRNIEKARQKVPRFFQMEDAATLGLAAIKKAHPEMNALSVGLSVSVEGDSHSPLNLTLIFAPLTDERCSYNAMIEFVTIKKLKG